MQYHSSVFQMRKMKCKKTKKPNNKKKSCLPAVTEGHFKFQFSLLRLLRGFSVSWQCRQGKSWFQLCRKLSEHPGNQACAPEDFWAHSCADFFVHSYGHILIHSWRQKIWSSPDLKHNSAATLYYQYCMFLFPCVIMHWLNLHVHRQGYLKYLGHF